MSKNSFKHFRRIIFFVSGLLCFSVFTAGCRKSESRQELPQEQHITEILPQRAVRFNSLSDETKEYLSEKTIALILGYGNNDENSVAAISALIEKNYGLKTEENDGLVTVIVYPEDFMVAGRVRISSLFNTLEGKPLAGIITIGAPEGLCDVLARLQDSYENGKFPYPVFSLLPQDNVLGSEAVSDFVLDYAHKTEVLETEHEAVIPEFNTSALILSSIEAMTNLRTPLPADKTLIRAVQKIVGNDRAVSNYFDSETGLQAINHFVFE